MLNENKTYQLKDLSVRIKFKCMRIVKDHQSISKLKLIHDTWTLFSTRLYKGDD